ncbi:ATP-binding protein [Andreprevotia chitinilytica]|uniref:ATP-binding protein n=1 Tax=Andreprevotia chitinilytica TaxID=396808 RepID=UPI0005529368|nr:ATP-binding protein [Andreprevotia chitinilytica]
MLRPLIKLYLLVCLGVAAAVLFINYAFIPMFHERFSADVREGYKGYVFVLTDYLERHSGAERAAALARLQENAQERFRVLSQADVARLSSKEQRDLRAGKLAMSLDGKDYYLSLRDGTVIHARTVEADNTDINVIAYGVVGLTTLLAVIAWVHFHWRDLRKLQEAARSFGAGNLATRATLKKKSNIYALAQQFNDMAERIQASILHQREMMHGISHELKTPIARLEFGIALLQTTEPEAQARQAALSRDVRELDELVTELLTLSQLEQGATNLVLMPVAVGELLDSVAASVANDVADRQIELSVHMADAPAEHICDPRLVARALLNLIRNASRYASHAITIRAEAGPDETLRLTVEDDGPGIPEADRKRVFEPFLRLDASRDRHTGGFGLGLAIVRRIALVHGGEVVLDRSALGGARFVIVLPVLGVEAVV